MRTIVLLLTLAACAPRASRVPPEPMIAIHSGPTTEGGLFLQGFDVHWEALPHRVSRLSIGAESGPAGEGLLEAEVRGGTWASGVRRSDTPRVTVQYGGVASPGVAFVPGSAELALEGRIGRGGVFPAEATVEITVALPPDGPRGAALVWLTGFALDSAPSHPEGYTPHAIAIRLGEPVVDGDHARFTATVRFEAAPVVDRRQRLGAYGSRVRIDYAVVVAEGSARRFSAGSRLNRREARLPVTVAGDPGWPSGIAGLSGFDVDLLPTGPNRGRYLRSLTVALEDGRYDGARGTYDAVVALRFANTSKLPRPLRVAVEAEFTLLQLGEAEVREGRWSPPAEGQAHLVSYPDMIPLDGAVGGTPTATGTPAP